MSSVYTGTQMRTADQETISRAGIPAMVLMERAALGVYSLIKEKYDQTSRILVLCGSGNNGADGVAIARLLRLDGFQTEVFFAGNVNNNTEQMRQQVFIWEFIGGTAIRELPEQCPYDLLVDAVFGIGLSRTISGHYAEVIEWINASGKEVVSVDIPSGINSDTGHVMGCAVCANVTVTFSFLKKGQLLFPGRDLCGTIHICDVGILPLMDEKPEEVKYIYLCEDDMRQILPQRKTRSNKGTYGNLLMFAGSETMAGAAILGANAAYRAGCGLVTVLSHPDNRNVLLSTVPEILFKDSTKADNLIEDLRGFAAFAAGPGIGTDHKNMKVLYDFCSHYDGAIVLDADALNILSSALHGSRKEKKQQAEQILSRGNLIITPHPGEMARLCNEKTSDIIERLDEYAVRFADRYGLICVLKDATTIITDGKRCCLSTTGCSGMATGGSGDVLTGMIGSFLAQGMHAFDAACCGVYFHGKAGEHASQIRGNAGLKAGDIIDHIPDVINNSVGITNGNKLRDEQWMR